MTFPETEYGRAQNHLAGQQIGMSQVGEFDGETMYGPDEGYVYFITLGEPAIWVKIGWTKSSPFSRMATLQTGCPYPMRMMGFVLATIGLEQDLHDVLREARRQGEWFEYTDRVARILQSHLDQEPIV